MTFCRVFWQFCPVLLSNLLRWTFPEVEAPDLSFWRGEVGSGDSQTVVTSDVTMWKRCEGLHVTVLETIKLSEV